MTPPKKKIGRPIAAPRPQIAARISQADYDRLISLITPDLSMSRIVETAVIRYLDLLDKRKSSAK